MGHAAPADAVTVRGLRKSFGRQPVLLGVDLTVPEGSLTAILGPSGSGKTTLLRILAGFEPADDGLITIGGQTVEGPGQHTPPERRRVGYVPQEISLFPHLDIRSNVGFGVARPLRRERVAQLLELTDISELAHRYPYQLSGGQQQRVALARALAPGPSLLLLDEPFSSLDASLRASVRQDVVAILRRAGATAVMVTHDQNEALSMADQVAVLSDGLVAQAGAPQDVYNRPARPLLAGFVGDANLLDGTLRDGHAVTAFGPLALAVLPAGVASGAALVVLLRPEQIAIAAVAAPGPLGPPTTATAVVGTVAQCDYYGHDSSISVTTDLGVITVRCSGGPNLAPGAAVVLRAAGPVVAWPRPSPPPPAKRPAGHTRPGGAGGRRQPRPR